MTKRRIFFAALALLLAACLAWWLSRAPRLPAIEVRSAPLVRTVQFSARVATPSRVDIGSTVTGRVLRVLVEEGSLVKAGDTLLRMENDELQAALAQAQASQRQAVARLAGLRGTGRSAAAAAVAQAESVSVAAQADLQRNRDLLAQGFVSEARLDEAQRAASVAQAQLAGARAQRAALAEHGTEVAQAEAQLALAGSAREAAQARLGQAVLKAPADARVLARRVEPGRIAQPGNALFTLALSGPPQLVAQVDERYLDQLQAGQRGSVVADAFPTQRLAARVLSIAPLVDAQRGAVEVKLSLDAAAPAFLREDMSLSVEVETGRRDKALLLPVAALRGDDAQGRTLVRVAEDGRVAERPVRLGLRTLDAAEVLQGLKEGERVLIGPTPQPGRRVRAQVDADPAAVRKIGAASKDDPGSAMGSAMGR